MNKRQILCTIAGAFLFAACAKKDDTATYTPTEADAAEVVKQSLEASSGGMADELSKMSGSLFGDGLGQSLECNVPYDTTLTYTLTGNATGTWTRHWNMLLNCDEATLDVNTSYEGILSGSIQVREREGTRTWYWSNLGPNGEAAVMNGNGAHSGSRTYSIGNENTFSWNQNASWFDVNVDKDSHEILSGTGSFTLEFSSTTGTSNTFEGSITFNGDGTATVIINGNEYIVILA